MSTVAFISASMLKYLTPEVLRLPDKFSSITFAWRGMTSWQIFEKCGKMNKHSTRKLDFTNFDFVFFQVGTNDVSKLKNSEPNNAVGKRIKTFLKATQFKQGAVIFVCTLFPRNDDEQLAAKVSGVNQELKRLIKPLKIDGVVIEVLDTRYVFKSSRFRRDMLGETSAKEEFLSIKDNLHLNDRGLAAFSRLVRMALKKKDPEAFDGHRVTSGTKDNFLFSKEECDFCHAAGHFNSNSCMRYLC